MENVRFEPAFNRLFTEFMRYTQLKQVITDFDHQSHFFDRLSEIWFCRNHVLFKLQWSMAMRDNAKWPRAWQYLDEAYGQAKVRDDYDFSHLNDQKAGLILESMPSNATSAGYFRRFKEVCDLLSGSMRTGKVTSHNYQTVKFMTPFINDAEPKLLPAHKGIMAQSAQRFRSVIQGRAENQGHGFIKTTMDAALDVVDGVIKRLE